MVADPFNVLEYDSADAVGAEALREIDRRLAHYGMGKRQGHAVIINEAHGLRKPVVRQFLGLLERLPDHVTVIFTTTRAGEADLFEDKIDASPLLSRCVAVKLTNQGLAQVFAAHVREIAQREGLDGQELSRYVRLARKCRNNCRAMLWAVESGELSD
jgi:hypothetical protein